MSSGENVLWIVTKRLNYGMNKVVPDKHFIFRTRKKAEEFRERKAKSAKYFHYLIPQRATWGPAQ